MSIRIEKIAKQVLREVSTVINTDLKDPELGFVTVTKVKMKDDMSMVTIFVSIMGDEREKKASVAALKRSKGYIRREIGARIRLRLVPEVEFELDTSMENIEDTLKLINALEKGKKLEK